MNTLNSLMRTNTNNNSVQQRTPTKKTKPKKKNTPHPVKVVYISNPMKIKTSAAEFRALVQELTGQDAESPPDPARFHGVDGLHLDSDSSSSVKNVDESVLHDKCVVPPPLDPNNFESQQEQQQQPSSFEGLDDDVFTPQMIENIPPLLPATVFYDSPHLSYW